MGVPGMSAICNELAQRHDIEGKWGVKVSPLVQSNLIQAWWDVPEDALPSFKEQRLLVTECPPLLHIVSCIKRRYPLLGILHPLRLHLQIQGEQPITGSPGHKGTF